MADDDKRQGGIAESLIKLTLASVVTIASVVVAWRLASVNFAPTPVLAEPGVIFVATESSTGPSEAPIKINMSYSGTTGARATAFTMALTQVLPNRFTVRRSPNVILILCGAISRHPRYLDNRLRTITWHQVALPFGEYNSLVGTGSECLYTVVSLTSESVGHQFHQAIVQGSSGPSASRVSGDRILYALPGVVAWPPAIVTDSFHANLIPPGSTLDLGISGFPQDLENVTASPQLPNSGVLGWAARLNPKPRPASYTNTS